MWWPIDFSNFILMFLWNLHDNCKISLLKWICLYLLKTLLLTKACEVNKNLKFYNPFLWIELTCLKATKPLQGDSLLSILKSSQVFCTHFIDLWKNWPWIRVEVLKRRPLDLKSSATATRLWLLLITRGGRGVLGGQAPWKKISNDNSD